MTMAASIDEQPIHTYLDDIKFQAVKGNNKRTSFISSDHQIVAKNAQVIKSIEKKEKLANADYRRQQTVLLKKLDQLQISREKTVHFNHSNSDGNVLARRRHSAPCLEKTLILSRQQSTPATTTLSSSPTFVFPQANKRLFMGNRERKLSSHSNEGDSNSHGSRESVGDEPASPFQFSRAGTKHSMLEARRRSHDIQAETSKMALEKIQSIVSGNRRRATIAEGATFSSLLPPSSELLNRLSRADSVSSLDKEG